jgi:hypothetical protein
MYKYWISLFPIRERDMKISELKETIRVLESKLYDIENILNT